MQGKDKEALPLYEKALDIFIRVLGKDHPNTLVVQQNLAACKSDADAI